MGESIQGIDAWNRRVIPWAQFSPAACADLADTVDAAIRRIEQWTVRVPGQSRLRVAARHLRRVAAISSYGANADELARTARAIQLGVDFFQLSHVLDPKVPGGAMGDELARSLRGTLEEDSSDTTAYELQSQFWFGLLLAHSGLRPAVVSGPGKRSDFRINLSGAEIGVEVKRPRTVRSAENSLSAAADQLSADHRPGIIAVDLSECLGVKHLTRGASPSREPADGLVQPHFVKAAGDLAVSIPKYERSDKFARVIALVAFARVIVWLPGEPLQLDGTVLLRVITFPNGYRGLVDHQTTKLAALLSNGLESVTGGVANRFFFNR